MWSYVLRRLLWMLPTLFAALLITFVVVRLQGPSLADDLTQQAMMEGGGSDGGGANRGPSQGLNVRNSLIKLYRTGNHLPALLNLRMYVDKAEVLETIQGFEADRGAAGERFREQIELWTKGRFYVEPLAAILADEDLADYYGPASFALTMCATIPVLEDSEYDYAAGERSELASRNERLKDLAIAYRNTPQDGFVTVDSAEEVARKRQALLDLVAESPKDYAQERAGLGVMLFETGFVNIMGKLFTGRLYSEQYKAPVFSLIADRWQITFTLTFLSVLISWSVSIPLGIYGARFRDGFTDRASTNVLLLLWSIPPFFVGTLLLVHLCTNSSVGVQLFPNTGIPGTRESLWDDPFTYVGRVIYHGALPLLTLTYADFTVLSRYMRGNMIGQLQSDYVRTARAKGVDEQRIVYGHALRNSMVTMVTLASGLLGALFASSVFVETIFSIEGLSRLLVMAAINSDTPLIMGSTVISVLLLLFGILFADIAYALVDPRIRGQYD